MRLVLFAALFCTVLSAPLPLEEEFNLPNFATMQENHEEKFLRVDRNKDKKLDFDEFLHMELAYVDAKKEEFDSLDKDKDGIVTEKEYEEHYHGVTSRSEARRTEYFAKVFKDFDEDFDMSLNQEELQRVLAERFLVKPRENFPKLFYTFDRDRSGGLDLNEYMEFDAKFPFDQTDPISNDLIRKEKSKKPSSNRGRADHEPPFVSSQLDEEDSDAIALVMAQGNPTETHPAPPQAFAPNVANTAPTTTRKTDDVALHLLLPDTPMNTIPIVKLAKVTKSI